MNITVPTYLKIYTFWNVLIAMFKFLYYDFVLNSGEVTWTYRPIHYPVQIFKISFPNIGLMFYIILPTLYRPTFRDFSP
jgi:hypothetical protein